MGSDRLPLLQQMALPPSHIQAVLDGHKVKRPADREGEGTREQEFERKREGMGVGLDPNMVHV